MVQKKHLRNAVCIGIVIGLLFSAPVFAGSLNVEYRSIDAIREYINNCGASLLDSVQYAETPVTTAPYSPGQLSDGTLQSALTILNNVRYIAGLPADIELKDEYGEMAQAGTLVNCVNGIMEHYPSKPADMEESLYQLGYSGTSGSNIGNRYGTLGRCIVHGWMADNTSANNLSSVGHRCAILTPELKYTGFGATGTFMAMYVRDKSGEGGYTNIAWPAQNMPAEYFNTSYPWSVTSVRITDASSVNVTLTETNDGTIWKFSSSSTDGLFYVNAGTDGSVIFRPDNISSYKAGDRFHVVIEGLAEGTLEYDVNFFDLKPVTDIEVSESISITAGDRLSLKSLAVVTPDDASNPTLIWTSADTEIASVEGSGSSSYVNGVSAGDTVLTVSSLDGTVKKEIRLHVHGYEYLSTEEGLARFRCRVCGEIMSGKVPTSFNAFWKSGADIYGSYYYRMPSQMDVGSTLSGMISNISYTADSENCFDEFVVELSDPEAGTVAGTGALPRIIWKKSGTFTVSVYPKYNSSLRREYQIRIVKPVESVSLELSPAETCRYDSELTLTAVPDGGKGTLLYRFVLLDGGKEEILREYGNKNTFTWTVDRTGTVGFRVDVMDQGNQAVDTDGNLITDENDDAVYVVTGSEIQDAALEPAVTVLADGESVLAGNSLVYGQKVSDLDFSEAVLGNTAFENADTGKKVKGSLAFSEPDAVLQAGEYETGWIFTPDDENYLPVQAVTAIEVRKADPVIIREPEPEQQDYHPKKTLGNLKISNGEESVPGTWSWKDSTIVPTVNRKLYTAVFVPEDSDNYNLYETDLTINVTKASPVLSEVEASEIVYGQALADSELRIIAVHNCDPEIQIAGTATWIDASVKPTAADSGATVYRFRFTPDDSENYELTEGETAIRVRKASFPPDAPEERQEISYQTAKVTDEILALHPDWSFGEEVQGTDLQVGENTFRVYYMGDDAENYESTEKEITLFRNPCTHEITELRAKIEATCTEEGYSGDTWCTICGKKIGSGEVTEALGHQPEMLPAVAATCVDTGLTEGSRCGRCGKIITAQETVPATGHTVALAEGETGKEICSVCGAVLREGVNISTPRNETEKALETPGKVMEINEGQLAAIPTDPSLPKIDESKIKTTAMSGKRMKATFNAVEGAENYVIAQRGVQDKTWRYYTTGAKTSYILKNLKAKSLVQFRVAVYRDGRIGPWSNISYRYYVKTTAKFKAGKRQFTATFKKVKGATGYQISYSLKKNMSGKKTVTSKSLKKVVKKLKKGKKYYIQYRPVKKYKGKTYLGIMRTGTVRVK